MKMTCFFDFRGDCVAARMNENINELYQGEEFLLPTGHFDTDIDFLILNGMIFQSFEYDLPEIPLGYDAQEINDLQRKFHAVQKLMGG